MSSRPAATAADTIQAALDVAEVLRYDWSHEDREDLDPHPWEHLGDAEKDARRLVDGVFALVAERDKLADKVDNYELVVKAARNVERKWRGGKNTSDEISDLSVALSTLSE